jgi:membrane-associated phospholipid phosphatase
VAAEPEHALAQGGAKLSRPLLGVAIGATAAAVAVSLYIAGHPYIPQDATLERDVQSVDWGPLTPVFAFMSWIGDAKGLVVEVLIFIAVLWLNRPAWIFAGAAPLTGAWYEVGIHLINRPRPTTAQVLHVTEHLGASSYPSGHTIFIVTVTVVLMACVGHRFLPRRVLWVGWLAAALLVCINALARIDSGTHWPTDVLGGFLIAVAWLSAIGAPLSASLWRRPVPSAPRSPQRPAEQAAG